MLRRAVMASSPLCVKHPCCARNCRRKHSSFAPASNCRTQSTQTYRYEFRLQSEPAALIQQVFAMSWPYPLEPQDELDLTITAMVYSRLLTVGLAPALALLVSCGGGGEASSPQTAAALAAAAESRARSLIQTGRCTADVECGAVKFDPATINTCSQGDYAAYLLHARNALAVVGAAADQRHWAAEAKKLESGTGFICIASISFPPLPACVQNQCTLKSGEPDPFFIEAIPD